MINKDKLALNLKALKSKIPLKPTEYTSNYPKTIEEALTLYCNQSTVHTIQACATELNEQNWPLPLWYNGNNMRIGFLNKILYYRCLKAYNKKSKWFRKLRYVEAFIMPFWLHFHFEKTYDQILLEAFEVNFQYAFERLSSKTTLQAKRKIIESVKRSYKSQDWIACISTIFPLIDFVSRKFLNTSKLSIDVIKICRLFEQNGFSKDTASDLMPHFTFVRSHKPGEQFFSEEREIWFNKMNEYDFGLIGPALSSFIRFANIYYGYFKEDREQELTLINRHAILHGSINNFGSKTNAAKLFTFLYLMVELEPVFEILFAE